MLTHKNLIVWQKSISLVKLIYQKTSGFPKEEIYGIVNQMRRASVSIPSNIAEGHGRNSDNELVRFLYIALGSATEFETQLIISLELSFLKEEDFKELNQLNEEIIKMLLSLIKTVKGRLEDK